MAKEIPLCPVMSAGAEFDRVCTQERCAWYLPNIKKCSLFVIAHNSLLDTIEKQKASR